jgi:methylthioribose-1-phosphate isomerase
MKVTQGRRLVHYRTVDFDARKNSVLLIDQTRLPHEFKIVATRDFRDTARAIADMTVRGAGAIGATAAYGLAQGVRHFRGRNIEGFTQHLRTVYETLKSARPTAIDPVNAMNDVCRAVQGANDVEAKKTAALQAAQRFADEDVEHCRALGDHGAKLIRNGMKILTHCNAGWLAFVDIGSATAPLYAAQEQGKTFHVYCSETRPRSQGATLTAWELANQGISHQVIADNASGHLMQRGLVSMVIVGSDRTLGRTGEVANKIGTYMKAVIAKRHGIPFYVAIPLSTLDWTLTDGLQIPIEERDQLEVLGASGVTNNSRRTWVRVANRTSGAFNPGFDVTPPELITGIITPVGVFAPKELWRHRKELESANP